MKKRILTMAMCVALTASAALAETAKSLPTTAPKAAVSTAANGNVQNATVKPDIQAMQAARNEQMKKRAQRWLAERYKMYQAIKLNDEQVKKAEEIDANARVEIGKARVKMQFEARKLKNMKDKKASIFARWKQKFALNKAKADYDKVFANARKSFEAILTKEQKAAFEVYDAEKRKEIEQFKKMHKGGPKGKRGFEKMGPPPPPPTGAPVPPPPQKK